MSNSTLKRPVEPAERARSNLRLALVHVLLASGFLVLFVVMQLQR